VKRGAWVLALLALSGCGMYGPLYLIEDEGAPDSAPSEPSQEPTAPALPPPAEPEPAPVDEDEEDEDDDAPNPRRNSGSAGES
jgi:predicted small lipoprotein YifL